MLRAELEPDTEEDADAPDAWWREHTRVAVEPRLPATALPVPGRHASRRVVDWLPGPLQGRVELGPWHVAAVALVLAAVLGGTAWWIARASPSTPTPLVSSTAAPLAGLSPGLSSGLSSGLTIAAPGSPSPSAAASVTVDVSGKVLHPGVLVLAPGSRVVDAIAAAGGPRPGVSLSSLNQAQLLIDGEQIIVGGPATAGSGSVQPPGMQAPAGAPVASGGPAGGAPVNLNTATAEQLDTLPGVGPTTAQAILTYRQQHGSFTSVDQLLSVQGIGEKTLAQIAPHATL